MSRNYANISTAIWQPGGDFAALSVHAQWAYMMLVTQPDISAAGVLPLSVKRWTSRARNAPREVLVGAIQELAAARFVVFDTDTEELLIRTFVKWDGGYNNRKRKPVIERAAQDVESLTLRRVLAEEFGKVGLPPGKLADSLSVPYGIAHPIAHAVEPAKATATPDAPPPSPVDKTVSSQVDSLSDSPSDSPCRFDGVAEVPTTHNPQPTTLPPSAGAAVAVATETKRTRTKAEPDPEAEANAATIVAAYIDGAVDSNLGRPAGTLIGRVGKQAKQLLTEGFVAAQLVEAATAMGKAGWHDLAVQLQRLPAERNGQGRRCGGLETYRNPVNQDDYDDWTAAR